MPTIETYFKINRGSSGLTEEFIYNNYGDIPVISATSDKFFIFGYVNENVVKEQIIDYPAILIIRVGKAGLTQIIDLPKYIVTENVLYLNPRKEFQEQFDLNYLEQKLKYSLLRNARGDINGQRNISSEIIYRLKFEAINIETQKSIGILLKRVERLKNICTESINSLAKLKTTKIKTKIIENPILSSVFNFEGGNSGLTDEFIYYNQSINEGEKIPVYSGATLERNFMGYISKYAKLGERNLKIFIAPSVIVSRKGSAGKMSYILEGEFTINDDAYVMEIKPEWKNKVNLRWFVNNYQVLFSSIVTSKSDNATFNKENAERQNIQIPNKINQDLIAKNIQQLEEIVKNLHELEQKVDNLLQYTIS